MRRSGGLGSVLPADAVPAAYVDVSLLVGMVASGEAPSSAAVADRASFASCTTYDELGRLRHAWTGAVGCTDTVTTVGSQPGGYNTSWTYTDDGNIATCRDGATTSTYGYADTAHPHAVTGATYAYTAGGNQRTRTSGTTTTTLTWDVLSRLTKAVTAVGGATTNTQTYVEAVDGTRLERTDGTTTTRYLPGQEIDYTAGVVSAARRYYAIAGTTVAVRVVTPATSATGGVLTWQVSDRQGSATLQVTDRTGAVARAYTDPYGAPRPSTTTLATDRGWLQKAKDTTGLVDLGARYCDPVLGRFLSPDPLNVQVTAQSAHAYAYGNNNPVTFTDPTGLYAVDEDGTAYNGNHQIGQDNRRPRQFEQANATAGNKVLFTDPWGHSMGPFPSNQYGRQIANCERCWVPTQESLDTAWQGTRSWSELSTGEKWVYGIGGGVLAGLACILACTVAGLTAAAGFGADAYVVASEFAAGTSLTAGAVISGRALAAYAISGTAAAAGKTIAGLAERAGAAAANGVARASSVVDDVLAETAGAAKRNLTSSYTLSADEALTVGQRWVGQGYTELGKPGSGVFPSADGLRQFRMDNNSLIGNHAPGVPHVHLETYAPGARVPTVNNHIPFRD